MNNRRDFLKKASLLAGATAALNVIPESIQRALAIEPEKGSTYLDAEHIVFLMQENRSFDHCYGTLKGVRGFNDPRAMFQPGGLPVWFQQNNDGQTYSPFHLDIVNTKATWMGDLPHGWKDMVKARNNGKMNAWLEAKRAGNPDYRNMPLTMGYYKRTDIPFYYALADAFTICDQHFCSSLTGTSANRSYFWSGTIREEAHQSRSVAHVDNSQINYKNVCWKTFPERLQEAGVPWKVYQNELSLPVGLNGEEEDWLSNFTDNNLEFHKQYHVKFHPAFYQFAKKKVEELTHLLTVAKFANEKAYQKVVDELNGFKKDIETYSPENFNKLSRTAQEIHHRAFVTNLDDPNYHQLEKLDYQGQQGEKQINVPKGDVFHQFRKDVNNGNLPTVSWLVAPCRFSDHPSSPWYGSWYVSEAMDILTKNPEVWRKTIFVLTYDENDGYFDHVSPFVPPLSSRPQSGAVPMGMDTQEEYITAEQEQLRTGNVAETLESPIGLGYRVPMVVASPWTKGGWVNSEVFDHTSSLQFMEHFLEKKYHKHVKEENISAWRRLVCGNLSSVFRSGVDDTITNLKFVNRNNSIKSIFSAQTKDLPGNYQLVSDNQLIKLKDAKLNFLGLGLQEPGIKPACALPYDLDVNLIMDYNQKFLILEFDLAGKLSSNKIIGVPLQVISQIAYGDDETPGRVWNFAVKAKEKLSYRWPFSDFKKQNFSLEVHGPNGFYRLFKGALNRSNYQIRVNAKDSRGFILNADKNKIDIQIKDSSYGYQRKIISRYTSDELIWNLEKSNGWYDFIIYSNQDPTLYFRYAGHVENGKISSTDPLMGNVL